MCRRVRVHVSLARQLALLAAKSCARLYVRSSRYNGWRAAVADDAAANGCWLIRPGGHVGDQDVGVPLIQATEPMLKVRLTARHGAC